MKVANKTSHWKHEPWTTMRIESPDVTEWQAYNTRTGQRMKAYTSYDKAFASISKSPYAEPWGC